MSLDNMCMSLALLCMRIKHYFAYKIKICVHVFLFFVQVIGFYVHVVGLYVHVF